MKMHKHYKIISCSLAFILLLLIIIPVKADSPHFSRQTITSDLKLDAYYVMGRRSTLQLSPTYKGQIADTSDYYYTSSNQRVAKVDSSGLVTSYKKGVSRITVQSKTNDSLICTTNIYVGKKVSKIRLSSSKKVIMEGNYYMLKASVSPSKAAYKKLEYISSNPRVAKVSSKGKVYGLSEGTATITIRTLDGTNIKRTCSITVIPPIKSANDDTGIFPNPFFENNMNNETAITDYTK